MISTDDDKIQKLKDRWEEKTRKSGFDLLFDGTGYITIGYYRTESDTLAQSVRNMTARVAEISEMRSDSHVLDLGCGRGIPVLDTAVRVGCSVVGVDLTEGNIDMANESLKLYKSEKKSDLIAEFYAASYFNLPEAVLNQTFTHVMMQTSLFYSHNRIDELFGTVAKLLRPGGYFVATDFCRISEVDEVKEFMTWNSMPAILSLDEMKAAFLRNGLEYCGGENLDRHCVKCHETLREKTIQLGILEFSSPNFHRSRENFVKDGLVTFQIIMARKT